jgi:hypothetical protein
MLVRCDRCADLQPNAWRCRRCRALLPHPREGLRGCVHDVVVAGTGGGLVGLGYFLFPLFGCRLW